MRYNYIICSLFLIMTATTAQVQIWQQGEQILPLKKKYFLKKAPFKIIVYTNKQVASLYASTNKSDKKVAIELEKGKYSTIAPMGTGMAVRNNDLLLDIDRLKIYPQCPSHGQKKRLFYCICQAKNYHFLKQNENKPAFLIIGRDYVNFKKYDKYLLYTAKTIDNIDIRKTKIDRFFAIVFLDKIQQGDFLKLKMLPVIEIVFITL